HCLPAEAALQALQAGGQGSSGRRAQVSSLSRTTEIYDCYLYAQDDKYSKTVETETESGTESRSSLNFQ
ncbi:MAG: hypothetical protein Q7J98_09705, partial [Kiritimatiellia bacterium]|nr:hypothetical protein [Kiritimatiellia bacterium]